MAETARTLASSALRTTNGSGASIDLLTTDSLQTQLNIDLIVTGNTPQGDAVSESDPPALAVRQTALFQVTIETSSDNATWRPVAKFSPGTKLRTERLVVTGLERYARCSWALHPFNGPAGYPVGCTFSVSGVSR
jgi:hypothetical protein